MRGGPTAAGGTAGTGDRAAAATLGSPGLPSFALGWRRLPAVPPLPWEIFLKHLGTELPQTAGLTSSLGLVTGSGLLSGCESCVNTEIKSLK